MESAAQNNGNFNSLLNELSSGIEKEVKSASSSQQRMGKIFDGFVELSKAYNLRSEKPRDSFDLMLGQIFFPESPRWQIVVEDISGSYYGSVARSRNIDSRQPDLDRALDKWTPTLVDRPAIRSRMGDIVRYSRDHDYVYMDAALRVNRDQGRPIQFSTQMRANNYDEIFVMSPKLIGVPSSTIYTNLLYFFNGSRSTLARHPYVSKIQYKPQDLVRVTEVARELTAMAGNK